MTTTTDLPGHDMHMGDADEKHGAEEAVRVEPGKTATLELMFDAPSKVLIGCHESGHWDSGMRATIDVE